MATPEDGARQVNGAAGDRAHKARGAATHPTATDDRTPPLSEPRWSELVADGRGRDEIAQYLQKHLSAPYKLILEEFIESADTCGQRFDALRHGHEHWRRMVILGTGAVAILNALSAIVASREPEHLDPSIPAILAGIAAVAAAVLAVLANLENFGNYLERGQAYREARELYLDAYREFGRLWQVYVLSLGYRAEALTNASELYRRICLRDSELRRKVKDMTETRSAQGAP